MSKCYTSLLILFFFVINACNSSKKNENADIHKEEQTTSETAINVHSYEVSTFEVKGKPGEPSGWGYDIFVDKIKTIHQPGIPAISGNHSFKTQDDAFRTGTYAADKMKSSGSLPTLTMNELDSLGVLPQTNP